MKLTFLPILLIILAALVAIPNLSIPPAKASSSSPWTFHDDFNYASIGQLQAAGWTTESIAPASYYSVGNSILTLLNDGHVGAGAGYSNIPGNVSDWSVSTRVEWIGTSGGVSSPVGSLQVAVGTVGHSYDWMADGYYGKFWIGMDGHNVANFASYAKQLNVWHVLQLDMIRGTLYGYFDGYLVGSYTEPSMSRLWPHGRQTTISTGCKQTILPRSPRHPQRTRTSPYPLILPQSPSWPDNLPTPRSSFKARQISRER